MEIIHKLGINETTFVQLAVFLVIYLILSEMVFKPYFAAFEERQHRTTGGEELAVELQKESRDLHTRYETKARQINAEINEIFSTQRAEATKEQERIVSQARAESLNAIEDARNQIAAALAKANQKINEEAPQLAASITNKLLAKN